MPQWFALIFSSATERNAAPVFFLKSTLKKGKYWLYMAGSFDVKRLVFAASILFFPYFLCLTLHYFSA
jgi:hypothetical protein